MTPAVLASRGLMNVEMVPFPFLKVHGKEEERQQTPSESLASHDVKITKAEMQANPQSHRYQHRRQFEERFQHQRQRP